MKDIPCCKIIPGPPGPPGPIGPTGSDNGLIGPTGPIGATGPGNFNILVQTFNPTANYTVSMDTGATEIAYFYDQYPTNPGAIPFNTYTYNQIVSGYVRVSITSQSDVVIYFPNNGPAPTTNQSTGILLSNWVSASENYPVYVSSTIVTSTYIQVTISNNFNSDITNTFPVAVLVSYN